MKASAVTHRLFEESREAESSQQVFKTKCFREDRAGRKSPRGVDQGRQKGYRKGSRKDWYYFLYIYIYVYFVGLNTSPFPSIGAVALPHVIVTPGFL